MFAEWIAAAGQTCVSGGVTYKCRAERVERLAGGGWYYQSWVVYMVERVARGVGITVTGGAAGDLVQEAHEVRDIEGAVAGYKLIVGQF